MSDEVKVKVGDRFVLLDEKDVPIGRAFEYAGTDRHGSWYGTVDGELASVKDRVVWIVEQQTTFRLGPPAGRCFAVLSDVQRCFGKRVWVSNDAVTWKMKELCGIRLTDTKQLEWVAPGPYGPVGYRYCCVELPESEAHARTTVREQIAASERDYRERCRVILAKSRFINTRVQEPAFLQAENFDLEVAFSKFVEEVDSAVGSSEASDIRTAFLRRINSLFDRNGLVGWHDTGTWECVYEAMNSLVTALEKRR